MFKKLLFLLTICILFVSCGNKVLKDNYDCFVNYDDALSYAKKKNLPLLVIFSSQGDDEESSQFVSGVLKDSAFKDTIAKKYAVFHADFSSDTYQKTVVSDNATEAEQELANTYTTVLQNDYQLAMLFAIEQMPSVFLCTKEGYVVTPVYMDYSIQNLSNFTSALEDCNAEFELFSDMVVQTKKGSAQDRVEAIDGLYLITSPSYKSFLLDLVKSVPELDKNNETGLCGKYIVAAAEAEALTAYSQGDVETAVKTYLQAADNEYVKGEDKQECFYTVAYLVAYSGSEDYEGILSYLQTAYDLAPASAKAPAIKEAINYFNTIVDNEAELSESID